MMSFTQNSDTTTKWPTPDIVHYLVDRERFQTQLRTIDRAHVHTHSWHDLATCGSTAIYYQ